MKMASDAVQISDEEISSLQTRLRLSATSAQDIKAVESISSNDFIYGTKAAWMMLTCSMEVPVMSKHPTTNEPVLTRGDLSAVLAQDATAFPALTQLRTEHLFSLMDVNNDGMITFPEFFAGWVLLVSNDKDKPGLQKELFFRAIDSDHDGAIGFGDLVRFVEAELMQVGAIPAKDLTRPDGWFATRDATAAEVCARLIGRYSDGEKLSKDQFLDMAKEIDCSATLTMHTFLPFSAAAATGSEQLA
jgi:Ca2+-binding EF-hand superfamily protein